MLNHSHAPPSLLNKLKKKQNKLQILCSDTKSFSYYSNSNLIFFFLLKLSFKTVIKYIKQIHRIWSFSAMNIGHVGAGGRRAGGCNRGERAPFPSSPSSQLRTPPFSARAGIFWEPGRRTNLAFQTRWGLSGGPLPGRRTNGHYSTKHTGRVSQREKTPESADTGRTQGGAERVTWSPPPR